MADDMGDKTEDPTGRRLSEARNQGNVARSQDLAAAIELSGAFILLLVFGAAMARASFILMRESLESQEKPSTSSLFELLRAAGLHMGSAIVPFLLLACVIAALAYVVQFGFIWNVGALQPKFDRLNPTSGLARLVNKQNLVKTLVNSLKLVVVSIVGWMFLSGCVREIAGLPSLTAVAAWGVIGRKALALAAWLFVIMLLMGVADFLFQKWNHLQGLKMTKQEVRDERRSMEGDPQIKGKRFRMAREIIRQRIGSAVPKADVVVTNPTHFSVAIAYDPETMDAPRVVAKGADELAMSIRHVAKAHGVPILERPPLARALYRHVDVGEQIHPRYYEAVAEVLAFVYRLDREAAAANATAAAPEPAPSAA